MSSGPEIRPQLQVQAKLAAVAGRQREGVQNIEVLRMLKLVQKLNQAVVVALHSGGDVDLNQTARVGNVLMKRNRVRLPPGGTRKRTQGLADGRIPSSSGMKMRIEKIIPLFLIRGQFRFEFFEARIIGSIGLLIEGQTVQLAGLHMRRSIESPIHADQEYVDR